MHIEGKVHKEFHQRTQRHGSKVEWSAFPNCTLDLIPRTTWPSDHLDRISEHSLEWSKNQNKNLEFMSGAGKTSSDGTHVQHVRTLSSVSCIAFPPPCSPPPPFVWWVPSTTGNGPWEMKKHSTNCFLLKFHLFFEVVESSARSGVFDKPAC